MTGFKLQISGVGSHCSINCATTTAHCHWFCVASCVFVVVADGVVIVVALVVIVVASVVIVVVTPVVTVVVVAPVVIVVVDNSLSKEFILPPLLCLSIAFVVKFILPVRFWLFAGKDIKIFNIFSALLKEVVRRLHQQVNSVFAFNRQILTCDYI